MTAIILAGALAGLGLAMVRGLAGPRAAGPGLRAGPARPRPRPHPGTRRRHR